MRDFSHKFSRLLGTHSRASQREFVGISLFLLFVGIPMALADVLIDWPRYGPFNQLLSAVFLGGAFIPFYVAVARRLHDIGMSGWYAVATGSFALMYVALVETEVMVWSAGLAALGLGIGLLHLPLLIRPGQAAQNRWGPDPLKGQPVSRRQLVFLSTLTKSLDFESRASRYEFWVFCFTYFLILLACGTLDLIQNWHDSDVYLGPATAIVAIVLFLPYIAVSIRRLHDAELSGRYYVLCLIPFIGSFILLGFGLLSGTPGPNRFGPDPHAQGDQKAAASTEEPS